MNNVPLSEDELLAIYGGDAISVDNRLELSEVIIKCTCGNTFKGVYRTNKKILEVDTCDKCHPYFTGKQRFVDTKRRVDLFRKKYKGI